MAVTSIYYMRHFLVFTAVGFLSINTHIIMIVDRLNRHTGIFFFLQNFI